MTRDIAYCDHNAGSPVRPEAVEAVAAALAEGGNPSSIHAPGRRAKARVETGRAILAAALGARAENLVFTSGATEAIHLAIDGARDAARSLILAAIEHDAAYAHAGRAFAETHILGVTAEGVVDLADLERLLAVASRPALVAIMLANNETGAVQPIAQAAALARAHGAMVLVDAAQGLGRLPLDMQALDATYVAVSSHKVGGPPGAGCLALAPGAPFAAPRAGGGQERGRRPGTENAPAIAGFGAAVAAAEAGLAAETARLRALRDGFEAALSARLPGAVIFAVDAARLVNTSLFALPGLAAETALISLDLEGVAVSSGAACSSGKVRGSRVLGAMGVPAGLAACALRASFGWNSTEDDVARLIIGLERAAARVTARGAA